MVDVNFFPSIEPIPLSELLSLAGSKELIPDKKSAKYLVSGANELEFAKPNEIALVAEKSYLKDLELSKSKIILISSDLAHEVKPDVIFIVLKNPQLLFAKILEVLYPPKLAMIKLQQSLVEQENNNFEGNVSIGKNVSIANDVQIGQGTIIAPNVVIGAGVCIGRNCVIGANVSIECSKIGDNVIIHAGACIGNEGFGWVDLGRTNLKILQLGRVIIQDDVEVGANTTIDRGALGDTIIGQNTKIDNLVQIGHNCQIGRNCLIAAMSGISGSTILEDGVLLGGGAGTSGHLRVGAGSLVHGRSAVTKDWPAKSQIAGTPAQDIKEFWRETATIRRLMRKSKK